MIFYKIKMKKLDWVPEKTRSQPWSFATRWDWRTRVCQSCPSSHSQHKKSLFFFWKGSVRKFKRRCENEGSRKKSNLCYCGLQKWTMEAEAVLCRKYWGANVQEHWVLWSIGSRVWKLNVKTRACYRLPNPKDIMITTLPHIIPSIPAISSNQNTPSPSPSPSLHFKKTPLT